MQVIAHGLPGFQGTIMRRRIDVLRLAAILAVISLAARSFGDQAVSSPPIDFPRDVRPILAENCLHCHGPDDAERQAEGVQDDAFSRACGPGLLRARSARSQ